MAAIAQLNGKELPPVGITRKRLAEEDPEDGGSVVKKHKIDQGKFLIFFIDKNK